MPPTHDTLHERLADQVHKSWSAWMKYVFSVCRFDGNGCAIIPPGLVARWKSQIATDYADLTEIEQRSDRAEADHFLKLFEQFLAPSEEIGDTGDAAASE